MKIEVVPVFAVEVDGVRHGIPLHDGAFAYQVACGFASRWRDRCGLMPGDDRIQWPAIPPGVHVPPVPVPEAA